MILVFLSLPHSRRIACFSPVEWKAEVVVSFSYLVSKCHHHLSVSIALIYLFIGMATRPPPSSHFFSCNISRLFWISSDYIQQFECTNQKHASNNSLMETQLQSLIFIYRLLETKQNPEYFFFLVFFWEISLSCKIKQTFQGCICIYFCVVTPGNKKIRLLILSFAQQFRFINRTKCNCSFYFSEKKKEMCNGKPWFFFFFLSLCSFSHNWTDWFLWICCTLEWRVWIWNDNHFAVSHP